MVNIISWFYDLDGALNSFKRTRIKQEYRLACSSSKPFLIRRQSKVAYTKRDFTVHTVLHPTSWDPIRNDSILDSFRGHPQARMEKLRTFRKNVDILFNNSVYFLDNLFLTVTRSLLFGLPLKIVNKKINLITSTFYSRLDKFKTSQTPGDCFYWNFVRETTQKANPHAQNVIKYTGVNGKAAFRLLVQKFGETCSYNVSEILTCFDTIDEQFSRGFFPVS